MHLYSYSTCISDEAPNSYGLCAVIWEKSCVVTLDQSPLTCSCRCSIEYIVMCFSEKTCPHIKRCEFGQKKYQKSYFNVRARSFGHICQLCGKSSHLDLSIKQEIGRAHWTVNKNSFIYLRELADRAVQPETVLMPCRDIIASESLNTNIYNKFVWWVQVKK